MWPAIIGAGASLLGGIIGGNSAKSAAKSQLQAARESNALQSQMYQQQREDLAPWRQAGSNALDQINALLQNPSSVEQTPGYQWRMGQGMQALQRSAPGQGGLYSGRAGKALERFGQGFASNEFTDQYNRLANLAGLGQTSATNSALAAGQYGQSVGNTLQNMGNARAAGTIGAGNAWTNALEQALRYYQDQQLLGGYGAYPGGMNDFYGGFGTSGD